MLLRKSIGFTGGGGTGIRSAFKRVAPDVIQKRLDNIGKGNYGDRDYFIKPGYKLYKIKMGDNIVRIAPQMDGRDFLRKASIYCSVGPDQGSYLVPGLMKLDIEDPIAELHLEAMEKLGYAHPLTKATAPSSRFICELFDMGKEKQSPDMLIADLPMGLGDSISILCRDPENGSPYDLSDIDDGRNVIFTKMEPGGTFKGRDGRTVKKVEYKGVVLGSVNKLTESQLKQVVPFSELFVLPDTDVLAKIAGWLRAKYEGAPAPHVSEEEKEDTAQDSEIAPDEETEQLPWSAQDEEPRRPTMKIKIKRRI